MTIINWELAEETNFIEQDRFMELVTDCVDKYLENDWNVFELDNYLASHGLDRDNIDDILSTTKDIIEIKVEG